MIIASFYDRQVIAELHAYRAVVGIAQHGLEYDAVADQLLVQAEIPGGTMRLSVHVRAPVFIA